MAQAAHGQERRAVLVLGMHRSGTSATAGLLALLGARPARTTMPADAANAKGYWESRRLMAFHERLLTAAGSAWHDWRPLDPAWAGSETGRALAAELEDLIGTEFETAPLIVVKDPRICRFVPVWTAALGRLGIAPMAVVPVRDPREVAQSLAARDGFPPALSALLWLRHCLEAEAATRGLPRCLFRYDALLADWRGVAGRMAAALGLVWPGGAAEAEIDAFVSRDLRHHAAAGAVPGLGPWIDEAYAALTTLAGTPGDAAALERLDAVRREFDRAAAAIEPLVEHYRSAARDEAPEDAAVLRAELAAARKAAARHAEASRTLEDRLAAAHRERAALLASTSWRMTAPLRGLADAARRLAGGREEGFDRDFYLASNPDVAASGMDPEEHYRRYGRAEGRPPRP